MDGRLSRLGGLQYVCIWPCSLLPLDYSEVEGAVLLRTCPPQGYKEFEVSHSTGP